MVGLANCCHTFMSLYENINEIIEANLKLICEKHGGKIIRQQLIDENGKRCNDDRLLAKLLDEKGLIEYDFLHEYNCVLTEFGHYVYENGGWIKFLKDSELKRQNQLKKVTDKETLESDLKILQKEKLEYEIQIRDKNTEIRNLKRDNLRLKNWDVRFRWYIAIVTFVVGFIIKHFISK